MSKRNLFIIVLFFVIFLIPNSKVFAYDGQQYVGSNGVKYEEYKGNYTVIGYKGTSKEIIIPKIVNGKIVNKIHSRAFDGCSSLTSIKIPESVTSIGRSAFDGCSSLTSITIPEGVTSISDATFYGCSSLTSIKIPQSVTSVGTSVFVGCSSLKSITIPENVTSIGEFMFANCSSLASITIPEGVTSISDRAFMFCSSLTSITIPESVTSIGEYAFFDCDSLTSITIPKGVTSIGNEFVQCDGLTSITIPSGVGSIDDSAFSHFSNLKILGYTNSYAHTYATTHWYQFESLGDAYDQILTVKFDTNGANTIPDAFVKFDSLITNVPNLVKDDWKFVGWYKDSRFSVPFNKNSDKVKSNMTLFAKWTPNIPTGSAPNIPKGLAVKSLNYNSNKLTWNAVTGATGYEVYRVKPGVEDGPPLTRTTGLTYTDTGLMTNSTYYYKIRAYKTVGTNKVYSGYTAIVSVKSVLSVPKNLVAKSLNYNSTKLTWGSDTGASGYEVYRATSSTGTYTLLTRTTGLNYTDSGLTTNNTYYYKVRAYQTLGTAEVFSDYTKEGSGCIKVNSGYTTVVSAKPIPSVPTNLVVKRVSSTSTKLTWGSVTGASGYDVYRATSSTGTYSLLNSTTGLSYTNTGLKANITYYYKVRAYRTVGTTKVYSGYTNVVFVK